MADIINLNDKESNQLYLDSSNVVHDNNKLSDILEKTDTNISDIETTITDLQTASNKIIRTANSITLSANVPYLLVAQTFVTESSAYVGVCLGSYSPCKIGGSDITCTRSDVTYTFKSSAGYTGGIYVMAIRLT